jgi:hypothetical protein
MEELEVLRFDVVEVEFKPRPDDVPDNRAYHCSSTFTYFDFTTVTRASEYALIPALRISTPSSEFMPPRHGMQTEQHGRSYPFQTIRDCVNPRRVCELLTIVLTSHGNSFKNGTDSF